MNRHKETMAELRRQLVGDSMARAKLMSKFVQLVREDERAKVLDTMGRARDKAATEPR